MKTVGDIIKISADFLEQKGIDRARRQVEELLSHILKLPRLELYMQFDRPLEVHELDQLRAFIKQKAQRMPWQYIVGEVEFLGCTIEVTPDVLIPRPETEILADRLVKELPAHTVVIWDLCCGSGCLGISIKKKRPDCRVILSDLSPKALEVAARNAKRNDVDVEIVQSDLGQALKSLKADVVICNPPYISEKDHATLEPEVRDWEPKLALVGGVTGYEFYERLAQELPMHLNKPAKLYLEIGTGMGNQIKTLFIQNNWKSVDISEDWASHDRFVLSIYS